MKDYLNAKEIEDIIILARLCDSTQDLLEKWKDRDTLSKDERKWFKTALSFGLKAYESLISRIGHSQIDKIHKRRKSMTLAFFDKYMEKKLEENFAKNMTEYQKDERVFSITEAAMFYTCSNCTRQCTKCYLYAVLVIYGFPEPTGEDYEGKACRFGHYLSEDKRNRLEAEVESYMSKRDA